MTRGNSLASKTEEQVQRHQGGILVHMCVRLQGGQRGCSRMTWRVAGRCVLGDRVGLVQRTDSLGPGGVYSKCDGSCVSLDPPRSEWQENIKHGELWG